MALLKKYSKQFVLLAIAFLTFIVQSKAQFFDDDGDPGGFDPPPDNDVPLDTYQWIMLVLALAYGIYIFWKHHKKTTKIKADKALKVTLEYKNT
jgi:hypothetical protein